MKLASISLLVAVPIAAYLSAQQPNPGTPPPVALFPIALINSVAPADNPMTEAKAKLGDTLFDDKRLSIDNSLACNTCHPPRTGFTTHTETSRGVGFQIGKRNAPSI